MTQAQQKDTTQPSRRRRSLLKPLLKGLAVLLVLLLVLIGWVATTESGLAFAWSLLAPRLPAGVTIGAVEGRLTGPLTVSAIEVDNDSMHLTAARAHLEWRPAQLLSATVHIEQLAVQGVSYHAKGGQPEPEETDDEPFALPDAIRLPVAVQLDELALDDIALTPAPEADAIVVDRLRLRDLHLSDEAWRIASLTGTGPRFDVEAQARVVPAGDYATDLALDIDLEADGFAPVHAQTRVQGDLKRLVLHQKVAAPYDITLDAELTDIVLDAPDEIGIDAVLSLDDTRLTAIRDGLPDIAPLTTRLQVAGTLQHLTVEQAAQAPYNMKLQAELHDIAFDALDDIAIDATLALDDTRIAAIRDDLPDIAPLTTRLRITGTPQQLQVEQTMAAPWNVQLQAELEQLLDEPSIEAKLAFKNTQLGAIKHDLPEIGLTSEIRVAGGAEQLDVRLDSTADTADYGTVEVAARLQYTPQALTIDRLQLQQPDSPLSLQAGGTIALASGNAMDLDLHWQQLQWPLSGQPDYRSRQGQLQLTGTLDDYTAEGRIDWQVVGQTEGRLQLTGSGDMQSFALRQLTVAGAPGDIEAQADIAWAPALRVSARINGRHINPGAVVADLPGDFQLQVELNAEQDDDGSFNADVDTLKAEGSLMGHALQLDATLALRGQRLAIDHLALDYADVAARIGGELGWTPAAALDLHWDIDAPDLGVLLPELAGSLHTQGKARGTLQQPQLAAELAARNLQYADNRVSRIELDADVDWSAARQSHAELAVAGVEAAGQEVDTLALQLDGTPAAHAVTLDMDGAAAQLALALQGALDQRTMQWDFTLTQLQAAWGELAPWTLAEPATGRVTADAQSIDQACLASAAARLCIDGEHSTAGTRAALRIADLAFAYAAPFLPDNLRVDGALSGTLDAALPAGSAPQIDLHLDTTAGSITTLQSTDEPVQVLAFRPGTVDVELGDGALDAVLDLPLATGGGAIDAEVNVAGGAGPLTAHELHGQLSIELPELEFITQLVDEVAAIDGHLRGNMQLSGTLARPHIIGDTTLAAEHIELLSSGLKLSDVKLAASGRGNAIDIDLTAQSGGGQLHADGGIDFTDRQPSVAMQLDGEHFQVANMPIARVWISPDLELSVTPDAIDVDGRLVVSKARITPRDLPAAGVETVADDTIIVTEQDSVAQSAARAVRADIVIIPEDVHIEGFGLETDLGGRLHVRQVPGQQATGSGELDLINGSYRAYGQNLAIRKGRIHFAGPLDTPGLELRAERYPADDVTVGVEVRGKVSQPRLTLYSRPTMSQAEILSWLLLGRPLDGTTSGESNLIARAALAVGGDQTNAVLQNLGAALGVDDIGLGSAAGHGASDAAFMVGKYLTPKLYISYGMGIFSNINTLSLRYTLNSSWKLESQSSSEATGGDIIYTFDR